MPPLYEDASYTVLPGTHVNETHYQVTAVCKGCTLWAPFDGESTALNGEGENYLAFAYSSVPVDDPTAIDTTFGIHERVGHWIHDFAASKSADFETWVAAGGEGEGDAKAPEAPAEPPAEEEEPPAEGEAPEEDGGDGESSGDASTSSSTVLTTTTTPADPASTSAPDQEPTEEPTPEVEVLPLPASCPGVEAPAFPLVTAEGWKIVKISGEVVRPRAVVVDSKGNLLVLESGRGLSALTLGEDGCISTSKLVINNGQLNHGLGITPDGTKVYVSSMTTAWEYSYDAETQEVSDQRVIVKGMYSGGHPSRSLVIPPATPHLLVMQLGSNANFDMESLQIETARANVKVFDISEAPEGGWDWVTEGWDLGYGLRNEIALVVDGNNQ